MSEQAVIRLMLASSCFGREVCPAPPCACARSLNDLLGAEQDAEIARLRRENAALVEAMKQIDTVCEDNRPAGCNHAMALDFVSQVAEAALRSATEKGEPT